MFRDDEPIGKIPYNIKRAYKLQKNPKTDKIDIISYEKINKINIDYKITDEEELFKKQNDILKYGVYLNFIGDYMRVYAKCNNKELNKINYVFWEDGRKNETEKWIESDPIENGTENYGVYEINNNNNKKYILQVYADKKDEPKGVDNPFLIRHYVLNIANPLKNSKIIQSEIRDQDFINSLCNEIIANHELGEDKEGKVIHLRFINKNLITINLRGDDLKYRIHYVIWEEGNKENTETWILSQNIKDKEYFGIYEPNGNKNSYYIFHVYKEFPENGVYSGNIPYKLLRIYKIFIIEPVNQSKIDEIQIIK